MHSSLVAPVASVSKGRSAPKDPLRREVLLLTDDLTMVMGLRFELMQVGLDLTWTNNFWVAMSYLQHRTFHSLLFDLRVASVEERYVLQMIGDHAAAQGGRKVFISSLCGAETLRRQIEQQGYSILKPTATTSNLMQALHLAPVPKIPPSQEPVLPDKPADESASDRSPPSI